MKLYREAGVNPLGCMAQMLVQMPIWIALYSVVRITLGSTPEALIDLSGRLYPWTYIQHAVPLGETFLWMNLSRPDFSLAILVGASTYVQQKVSMAPASDDRQQSMNNTMLWMMPLMFMWFSLSVPAGLPLYWFVSAIVSIVLQVAYMGSSQFRWRNLLTSQPVLLSRGAPRTAKTETAKATADEEDEEVVEEGVGSTDRRWKKRSRHGRRRRKR